MCALTASHVRAFITIVVNLPDSPIRDRSIHKYSIDSFIAIASNIIRLRPWASRAANPLTTLVFPFFFVVLSRRRAQTMQTILSPLRRTACATEQKPIKNNPIERGGSFRRRIRYVVNAKIPGPIVARRSVRFAKFIFILMRLSATPVRGDIIFYGGVHNPTKGFFRSRVFVSLFFHRFISSLMTKRRNGNAKCEI